MSQAEPAPFGALSATMLDHVYELSGRAFIFTSPWVHTPDTRRHAATLLLSAAGLSFTVSTATQRHVGSAVLVPPLLRRGLVAVDVGLVSINITPHHPAFNLLRRSAGDQLCPLGPELFKPLQAVLLKAYEGKLTLTEAAALVEQAQSIALLQLPAVPAAAHDISRSHTRSADALLALIRRGQENCNLDRLSRELGVSYHRASHLVAEIIGLPLKSYLGWHKMLPAWHGLLGRRPLAEVAFNAGFADLAHMSRTWKRKLGVAPSYMRSEAVRVILR